MSAALLAGCFKQDVEYPEHWAPVARQWIGCPDLTGTYWFNGDYVGYLGGALHASPMKVFFPIHKLRRAVESDFSKVTHTSIAGPKNGHIKVSVWAGERLMEQQDLQSGQFACGWGKVTTIVGRNEYVLRRSKDGALVTKVQYTDCIFVFLPLCTTEMEWIRWPVVQPGSVIAPLKRVPTPIKCLKYVEGPAGKSYRCIRPTPS